MRHRTDVPTAVAILDAAERIHRDEGLTELSVRRVAQVVGVTPMALYHHYPNKDSLLDALVDRGFATLETYFTDAATRRTAPGMLRAFLGRYRDFALDHPRLFDLMFLTRRPRVPHLATSLHTTTSPAFGTLLATLDAAGGALRLTNTADTVRLVWATAHGLIALHRSGRFGDDAREFSRTFDRTVGQQVRLLTGGGMGAESPPRTRR